MGKQRSGSGKRWHYVSYGISLDRDLFHNWVAESETKVVCGARNKERLLQAVEMAKELGMEENKDYWLIYDACRTELESESLNGTLTCIGFRPMEAEEIDKIGKIIICINLLLLLTGCVGESWPRFVYQPSY